MSRLLEKLLDKKGVLILLIIINIIGFFVGIYYYLPLMSSQIWYYWIFMIDSSLYLMLFAFIAFLLYDKRRIPMWIVYLTAVGLIKTGLWTLLLISIHIGIFSAGLPIIGLAFLLHLLMILEGCSIKRRIRVNLPTVGFILAWFLLNDFLDYYMGLNSIIPVTSIPFFAYESIMASILLVFGIYIKWGRINPYDV